jgi:tetratricopeptide (TPR) repeat protein
MNLDAEQIAVIVLFAVALLILVLNDRIKERLVRKSERKDRTPPRRYLNYRTSWRQVFAVGLIVLLVIFFANKPNLPQLPGILVIAVAAAFFAVCLIAIIVQRRRHRVFVLAVEMAQRGDVEGAIALLEEQIAQKGPSALAYNNLAVFRGLQGKWHESLHLIEQAELHGGTKPLFLGNKGLALWKLGRLQEALPLLQEAARRFPRNLGMVINHGCVLAELGRKKEALDQLRRADHLFASRGSILGPIERAKEETALESFRQLVSHASDRQDAVSPE